MGVVRDQDRRRNSGTGRINSRDKFDSAIKLSAANLKEKHAGYKKIYNLPKKIDLLGKMNHHPLLYKVQQHLIVFLNIFLMILCDS